MLESSFWPILGESGDQCTDRSTGIPNRLSQLPEPSQILSVTLIVVVLRIVVVTLNIFDVIIRRAFIATLSHERVAVSCPRTTFVVGTPEEVGVAFSPISH